MQLFSNYIVPLTTWLHNHPQAALFITFFIAFLESLAIIGSLIPGSITMTAIGILAGSGVIRIDLTLLAATLGAIAGDGISYLLGYFYSDRLTSLWPFNRYPSLLAYGQMYFEKHGGKSVIIGRFVGPLRSIIPVIAGMMHMPQWRFFVANILSGIGWAFLYITPGILIGEASHELSPEQATRLLLLLLFVLIGMWLMSLGIKSLFSRCRVSFQSWLHRTWSWFLSSPTFSAFTQKLTPINEETHAATAALFLFLLISIITFFGLLYLQLEGTLLTSLNVPVHLFLQSLRTQTFDIFFAISVQMISPLTFISLFTSMLFYMLYKNDFKGVGQWLLLALCSILFIRYMHQHIHSLGPSGILAPKAEHAFPALDLFFSTTCFVALLFHNKQYFSSLGHKLFSFILICALSLGGLGIMYLGDYWCGDVLAALLAGLSLALGYWIVYRTTHYPFRLPFFPWLGVLLITISTSLSCFLSLNKSLLSHETYFKQHVLNHALWWRQEKPVLPIFSKNRLGHTANIFNVQYVGELRILKKTLMQAGWKTSNQSLIHTVLKKVDSKHRDPTPIFPALYLNQKPKLTLIYQSHPSAPTIQLQLWRSNYYLTSLNRPIWLGCVQTFSRSKTIYYAYPSQDGALIVLDKALPHFKKRKHLLHQKQTRTQLLLLLQAPELDGKKTEP